MKKLLLALLFLLPVALLGQTNDYSYPLTTITGPLDGGPVVPLTTSFGSQTSGTALMAPCGSDGTPSFRLFCVSDNVILGQSASPGTAQTWNWRISGDGRAGNLYVENGGVIGSASKAKFTFPSGNDGFVQLTKSTPDDSAALVMGCAAAATCSELVNVGTTLTVSLGDGTAGGYFNLKGGVKLNGSAGSDNQVLTTNGSTTPTWQDLEPGSAGSTCADEMFGNGNTTLLFQCSVQGSRGTGSAVSSATGTASHPGVATCSTGLTATISCAFIAGGNGTTAVSSTPLASVLFGSGRIVATVWAKIQTLPPDTTDNAAWYMAGFSDEDFTASAAAEAVDGYYFRYTKGANSDKWLGVSRSNSNEGTCDTTVAADTNFHNFTTDLNAAATQIDFYIDGVLKCSITDNTKIPSGAGRESTIMVSGVQRTSGTTTARLTQVDAYRYHFYFTTPR